MHRITASLLLFCGTIVGAPQPASALLVTVPTDLAPGAQYRLAFLTNDRSSALSTSIADYNSRP